MSDTVNHIDYDQDGYGWAMEQAALLRAGRLNEIDRENIAEEIESVGKSERRTLESHLARLMMHLLKWEYQAERRGRSWANSIESSRMKLRRVLRDNPSLKPALADMIAETYPEARLDASDETGLPKTVFPADCPWPFDQMMADGFWPGEAAVPSDD
jgi:hypothetical protein